MKDKKLPKAALEYFRKVGREGGALGGKAAAANMTPEQLRKLRSLGYIK